MKYDYKNIVGYIVGGIALLIALIGAIYYITTPEVAVETTMVLFGTLFSLIIGYFAISYIVKYEFKIVFLYVLRAIGLIATSAFSAGVPYLMMQNSHPVIALAVSISIGILLGGGYIYNEMEIQSAMTRLVLRVTGMVGAGAVCFSKMKAFLNQSIVNDTLLHSLKGLAETTKQNAENQVLTAQSKAIQTHLANIDLSVNPAEFLIWVSNNTGLPQDTVFILFACLGSIAIDYANSALYHGNGRQSVLVQLATISSSWLVAGARSISPVFTAIGNTISHIMNFIGTLAGIFLAIAEALLRKISGQTNSDGRSRKKSSETSGGNRSKKRNKKNNVNSAPNSDGGGQSNLNYDPNSDTKPKNKKNTSPANIRISPEKEDEILDELANAMANGIVWGNKINKSKIGERCGVSEKTVRNVVAKFNVKDDGTI